MNDAYISVFVSTEAQEKRMARLEKRLREQNRCMALVSAALIALSLAMLIQDAEITALQNGAKEPPRKDE